MCPCATRRSQGTRFPLSHILRILDEVSRNRCHFLTKIDIYLFIWIQRSQRADYKNFATTVIQLALSCQPINDTDFLLDSKLFISTNCRIFIIFTSIGNALGYYFGVKLQLRIEMELASICTHWQLWKSTSENVNAMLHRVNGMVFRAAVVVADCE